MNVGDRVESIMGGRRAIVVGRPVKEKVWAGYGQKPLEWTLVLVDWDDVESRTHERVENLKVIEEARR